MSAEIAEVESRLERAEIDRSLRGPVLFFFASGVAWLLVGSLLGLLAAWKMVFPGLLDSADWLTFGRVRPAHLNIVIYGWASAVGMGVGIWLMARLCRVALPAGRQVPWRGLLVAAGVVWNAGVAAGTVGILCGESRSIEWLELRGWGTRMLFLDSSLVGAWGVIMFRYRQPGHVYVSQWYLLAAFLWFPWLYATANILLIWRPVAGSVVGAVNWWYGHNILGLWFTPIGLASAYYMIPKVLGRPVHSYWLAIVGFWALALFYSWNGMHHLIGGPFPAWMVSASVVASVMMFVPVIAVAINHHLTMRGHFHYLKWSPTLRFTVFGAMTYTAVSFQGSLMALPALNNLTHFTDYTVGHAHLGLYGFFTMTMFGAMYYIVPRLVGWEWPSPAMIRWHFWLAASGIALMFATLTLGGFVQGLELNDPQSAFLSSVAVAAPFRFVRGLSGFLLMAAHLVFAVLFVMMLLRRGERREEATLLARAEEGNGGMPAV